MQVLVRDNNVDQALRVLKKKLQREGVLRELKLRRHYEKPSERAIREKTEAIRRARKMARKQAILEGLIAPPKRKPPVTRPPLRGLFSSTSSLRETSNRPAEVAGIAVSSSSDSHELTDGRA